MPPLRVGLVLLLAAVTGCSSSPKVPSSAAKPSAAAPSASALPPVAKEEVQAFALSSYADDGRKRWEVLGQSADLSSETIPLTGVTATAYGEKTSVTLTAKAGTFDRQERNVHLEHDVKAVTTEGTTMTTESLDWDNERRVASTKAWATVERANLTVHGRGATGSPDLKRVRFETQVQVEIKPATKITCRGALEVDYGRHRARFYRGVHVWDARGEIWADRMDVQMDPKTHQVTRVQCWGHVRIRQNAQLAQAHRALYRQDTGQMVLIGHPRLSFYTDQALQAPHEHAAAP